MSQAGVAWRWWAGTSSVGVNQAVPQVAADSAFPEKNHHILSLRCRRHAEWRPASAYEHYNGAVYAVAHQPVARCRSAGGSRLHRSPSHATTDKTPTKTAARTWLKRSRAPAPISSHHPSGQVPATTQAKAPALSHSPVEHQDNRHPERHQHQAIKVIRVFP